MYQGNPAQRHAQMHNFYQAGRGLWDHRLKHVTINHHGRFWHLFVDDERVGKYKTLIAAVDAHARRTVFTNIGEAIRDGACQKSSRR